jgi:heme/copper-type cytochrome/quinol oxidase subunit 3
MIRLAELLLFVAPIAAYALWRITIRRGMPGPSRSSLMIILAGLLLFGAGLAYFGVHERDPAGTHYVPAELRDGRIVPGHGT